ncbi:MAG: bifunctional (p)ppGpp synthetase/guanosine-3',5'-bis(diphosphate) 3'-pyrophosphohydrolase [Hyphomicrobiales bacterium]
MIIDNNLVKEMDVLEKKDHLVRVCKQFANEKECSLLEKAYEWAVNTYGDKEYITGRPYTYHLIEVARICVEDVGLGITSAISSVLHSITSTGKYSIEDVGEHFGNNVAEIVEGFSKISQLKTEKISYQSDVFRKLFLTFVDDIRVILIKIAHRLHDIRSFDDIPENKRQEYANEINYIYIPITHRLGLYKIKAELEERVMKYENPEIYNSISEKIRASEKIRNTYIKQFTTPIKDELVKQSFSFEMKGRVKSVHSIWMKMKRQNIPFEKVYDLFAIRIIVNSPIEREKSDCWRIYSIVTNFYNPSPKRLRDWITTPKASGYESLHTTVEGPNDKWVEVQIRTSRMDEVAEKGQAAHWKYKEGVEKKNAEDWLNQVRDVLENPDQLNFDLSNDIQKPQNFNKIFVFTPNGDLKELPLGAIALDFAYDIHSDVGNACIGAKINNKPVPIRYELQNGDKIEILTSKKQNASQDWLSFVKTEKARKYIKKALREEHYKEADLGKEILNRKLKNWKLQYNDEVITQLVNKFKFPNATDLYYAIATEKLDVADIKKELTLEEEGLTSNREKQEEKTVTPKVYKGGSDFLIIDDKIDNVTYRLAKCCNPIAGDEVFGFVTVGKGITIHRLNCPNASQMIEKYNYRIIKAQWKDNLENIAYKVVIKVTGEDVLGIVNDISQVITNDLRVNMLSIMMKSFEKSKSFEGHITVQIKDKNHLEQLCRKLEKLKGIDKATRIN